jgi:hypothetical protein
MKMWGPTCELWKRVAWNELRRAHLTQCSRPHQKTMYEIIKCNSIDLARLSKYKGLGAYTGGKEPSSLCWEFVLVDVN